MAKKGETISLPELPPQLLVHSGDPDLDRLANAPVLALCIVSLVRGGKHYSPDQVEQLQRLFEKECRKLKFVVGDCALDLDGHNKADRVAIVSKGTKLIDSLTRWFRRGLSGSAEHDKWEEIRDQMVSFFQVRDVMKQMSTQDKIKQMMLFMQPRSRGNTLDQNKGSKHGHGKLDDKVRFYVQKHPEWTSSQVAAKCDTSPETVRGTESWKQRNKCPKKKRKKSRRKK